MTNLYLTTILLSTTIYAIHGLPRTVDTEEPNYPKTQTGAFSPKSPSPFRTSITYVDSSTSPSQQRQSNYIQNPYLYQNTIPIKQKVQVARPNQKNQPQQYRNQEESLREKDSKELEEEEIEEPDRLSILLPQSKFDCTNRNTGYYADEELGCEVFHYCQDNARHSWICPEGFTFHQVHLICMPPGGDNICEKSSQYHFVNEYLYKPVNLEEYQQKPNVSLRYSERFYPENYYEENEEEANRPHRTSIRVQQETAQPASRPAFRPETTIGQVFRSPNEVNIPLQQRRPQYVTQRFFTK